MKKSKAKNSVSAASEAVCTELKRLGAYELNLGISGWRWFGFSTTVSSSYLFINTAGEIMAGETLKQAQKITLAAIKKKVKHESEV